MAPSTLRVLADAMDLEEGIGGAMEMTAPTTGTSQPGRRGAAQKRRRPVAVHAAVKRNQVLKVAAEDEEEEERGYTRGYTTGARSEDGGEEEQEEQAARAVLKKQLRLTRVAVAEEVARLDRTRCARLEVAGLRQAAAAAASTRPLQPMTSLLHGSLDHGAGHAATNGDTLFHSTLKEEGLFSSRHPPLQQQQQRWQQPPPPRTAGRSSSKRLEEAWGAFIERNEKRWGEQLERESRKEVEGRARQRAADARISRLEDATASLSKHQHHQHQQPQQQQHVHQWSQSPQQSRGVAPMIKMGPAAAAAECFGAGGDNGGAGYNPNSVPSTPRRQAHDYDSLRWTQPHSLPHFRQPPSQGGAGAYSSSSTAAMVAAAPAVEADTARGSGRAAITATVIPVAITHIKVWWRCKLTHVAKHQDSPAELITRVGPETPNTDFQV